MTQEPPHDTSQESPLAPPDPGGRAREQPHDQGPNKGPNKGPDEGPEVPRRLAVALAVLLALMVGAELALGLELRPAPPAPGTTGLVGAAATVAVLVLRRAVRQLLGARRA
ncbi:MAG: hypothetical protein AAF957_03435 [Planctomycetota bacterium]